MNVISEPAIDQYGPLFCDRCGAKTTTIARFCPECGRTLAGHFDVVDEKQHRSSHLLFWVYCACALFVIAALAFGLIVMVSQQNTPAPQAMPEDVLKAKAETAVRESLKDPGSAIFQGMIPSEPGNCVIGRVNAKNSFGGYTGDQNFVWFGGRVTFETSSLDRKYLKAYSACTQAETDALRKSGILKE